MERGGLEGLGEWRAEFDKRGISDVYLIPGGEGRFERTAVAVSWHPGGQFVDIDRSDLMPILKAVAELSRKLPPISGART